MKPVAWMYDFLNSDNRDEVIRNWVTQDIADIEREKGFNVRPLYAAPPKREWVGLTDDEVSAAVDDCDVYFDDEFLVGFARRIEDKLKEKNT